jgi:uncharacterized membrane protein YtjA (UPF0391 family)
MSDTKRHLLNYVIGVIVCIIINIVYSLFSHNVASNYMTFMFLIPIGGYLISLIANKEIYRNLVASATLSFTLASLLQGIIDIAGTDSYFVGILFYIGLVTLIISFISLFIRKKV